jgi:hypothetical protein
MSACMFLCMFVGNSLPLKMPLQNQDGCASETHSKLFVAGHDSHPLKVRAYPPDYNSNNSTNKMIRMEEHDKCRN